MLLLYFVVKVRFLNNSRLRDPRLKLQLQLFLSLLILVTYLKTKRIQYFSAVQKKCYSESSTMAAGVTLFYFTWKQETDVNFPFKIQIHTENHVKIM